MPHVSAGTAFVIALILVLFPLLSDGHSSGAQTQDAAISHVVQSSSGDAKLNVAVLLYDGALVLDYGIAAEMFLATDFMRRFNVYTVGRKANVTLSIVGAATTDFTFDNAPWPDIMIVPGGPMWAQEGAQAETQEYLRKVYADSCIMYSICTGAMVLGKAGILDGHTVTTNHGAAKMLQQLAPKARVVSDRSFVDDGRVVTAAGSGTAIDATLHVIGRFCDSTVGRDLGDRYMDYPYGSVK